MSIESSIQRNMLQRIKTLFLGKKKPNFLTRISVGIAFIIWLYLMSWHLLTVLSLSLMNSLKHPEKIKATFTRKGSELYNIPDAMNALAFHSLIEIFVYIFILLGLILVWRKKKIGFLFFIIGNISGLLITILIMGWAYLINETSIVDFILIGSTTINFGIGALFFYKWKSKKETIQDKEDL